MWLVVQHSADDRLKQIWLAEFGTWICERYDWWFSNSADGEPQLIWLAKFGTKKMVGS